MQDFVGQYRAEMLYRIIITAFGFAGIAYGYYLQSFMQTVLVLSAGFALAAVVSQTIQQQPAPKLQTSARK